jgi:hypothetical protein
METRYYILHAQDYVRLREVSPGVREVDSNYQPRFWQRNFLSPDRWYRSPDTYYTNQRKAKRSARAVGGVVVTTEWHVGHLYLVRLVHPAVVRIA